MRLLQITRWLSNPLLWSNADKMIVFASVFALVNAPIALLTHVVYTDPSLVPAVFRPVSPVIYGIQIGFVGIAVAAILLLLHLRRSNPGGLWYIYTLYPLAAIHDAIGTAWFGHSTNSISLLSMLAFPFIAYLFFDYVTALITLSCFLLVYGIFLVLEYMGHIPYAPGLESAPFDGGVIMPYWVIFNLGVGSVIVLAMFLISGALITSWRTREAEVMKMSEFLKNMFGRYMSTEIMQELMDNPDKHLSSGEKREVTVVMTDLRGFSAISERLSPEQVVRLLNNYVSFMADVCKKYNGTLNDIIGDALLMTFGAPVRMDNHALAAVACAVQMQNTMAEVNEANSSEGLPHIAMGVGIHTDEVIIGNIGSEDRAKFTVIGSGVNLASRIEAYTVGGQVLVSDNVKSIAGGSLRVDRRFELFPKGSESPITVYDIGGVGLPYNVALVKPEEHKLHLPKVLRVGFVVVEGKQMGGQEHEGSFSDISLMGGILNCTIELEMLSNIKLRLLEVSEDLAHVSFYGKVTAREGQGRYMVKFTAMPTEINAFVQAAFLIHPQRQDV